MHVLQVRGRLRPTHFLTSSEYASHTGFSLSPPPTMIHLFPKIAAACMRAPARCVFASICAGAHGFPRSLGRRSARPPMSNRAVHFRSNRHKPTSTYHRRISPCDRFVRVPRSRVDATKTSTERIAIIHPGRDQTRLACPKRTRDHRTRKPCASIARQENYRHRRLYTSRAST